MANYYLIGSEQLSKRKNNLFLILSSSNKSMQFPSPKLVKTQNKNIQDRRVSVT